MTQGTPVFGTKLERVLAALAALLLVALLVEEAVRVAFPWDLRMFSESTLLTNMVKLTAGQTVYTDPADANSFIYAPGLEAITFGVLRPLGLQLDIRACRVVCVLLGAGAALLAGIITTRFASGLAGTRTSRAALVVASSAAALLVFKSFTSDTCHPDNLYCLHAMALIALTQAAIVSGSFRHALLAMALAGLGFAAKQTACLGLIGAAGALLYFHGKTWGIVRSALLGVVGLGCLGATAYLSLRGWGRFWEISVLSRQSVEMHRVYELARHYTGVPHRLFIALALPASMLYIAMQKSPVLRRLFVAWLAVGVTEVLPALVSYFKVGGWWNNLTIVDLWSAIPTVAVLWHAQGAAREAESIGRRAMTGGALAVLLLTLMPFRTLPTPRQYEYGRTLEASIAKDVALGKHVLVSHGASASIRAGVKDVLFDRASSIAELGCAEGMAATRARLLDGYYSKVYLMGSEAPGYCPEVQSAIDAHFHVTENLPGDASPWLDEDLLGFQGLMRGGVKVFEANE